jgi:beta-barrel assembly-enhancing protease
MSRAPHTARWSRPFLAVLGSVGLLCACAPPPRGAEGSGKSDAELGVDREREITADVAKQLRAAAPFVSDPIVLGYVNEIGQALVRSTEPQPFVYRFAIIQDETLNAFTIGGGYVYLNSGVIAQAGDVSELAGVLAHEIAHVRERHVTRRQEGQTLSTLLTLAAAAAAAAGADPGVMVVAESLNVSMQLKNSRSAEGEADYEGIQYMVRTGYAPRGMVRFFERILAERPTGTREIPSYLFTHPAVDERISATRGQIARMSMPGDLRTRDDRLAEMQARLALLVRPVAGGSGLLARSQFDRTLTDAPLAEAEQLRKAGDLAAADRALAQAESAEPRDPRVALARAELAEQRGELETARGQLERAFGLDPNVPLVAFQLGRIHGRLGDRTRAVFYLEQAAARASAGSSLARRIEKEIELLSVPIFDVLELQRNGEPTRSIAPGESLSCVAQLARRARTLDPEIQIRWIDPDGEVAHEERLRPGEGGVRASHTPTGPPRDGWRVQLDVGETQRFELRFQVRAGADG